MTFNGVSDDLKSRRGDLKSSMRPRDLFKGLRGTRGGGRASQGVKGPSRGSPWGHRAD